MTFLNSYRFKIFIALWVFGILLVVMYHLLGTYIVLFTQHTDKIVDFELKKEVAHFFDSYKEHNQTSYPNSRFFKSYVGASNLPDHLRDNIEDLDIGYHFMDIKNDTGNNQAYYVAIFEQPDTLDRVYILYDYTLYANEYIDYQIFAASRRFLLVLVIVGVFGIFMGLLASKKLIAPLNKLVLQVKGLDPDHLPTDFSKKYKNDEVGILAKALEKSMHRIKEFIDREKNFA